MLPVSSFSTYAALGEAFDAGQVECSRCKRPAEILRGCAEFVALCSPCDEGIPLRVLESNGGEFLSAEAR